MNQAEVHKLITSLRFRVSPRPHNMISRKDPASSVGRANGNRYRLELIRKQVTSLIVNERLEMTKYSGVTVREYTERLIQEAINHGDTHRPTMELADWWLEDKAAIHKLFKVMRMMTVIMIIVMMVTMMFEGDCAENAGPTICLHSTLPRTQSS